MVNGRREGKGRQLERIRRTLERKDEKGWDRRNTHGQCVKMGGADEGNGEGNSRRGMRKWEEGEGEKEDERDESRNVGKRKDRRKRR